MHRNIVQNIRLRLLNANGSLKSKQSAVCKVICRMHQQALRMKGNYYYYSSALFTHWIMKIQMNILCIKDVKSWISYVWIREILLLKKMMKIWRWNSKKAAGEHSSRNIRMHWRGKKKMEKEKKADWSCDCVSVLDGIHWAPCLEMARNDSLLELDKSFVFWVNEPNHKYHSYWICLNEFFTWASGKRIDSKWVVYGWLRS